MEKKLTYEEIVKALKFAIAQGEPDGIGFWNSDMKWCGFSMSDVLNLIHRLQDENGKQKAEIERLTKKHERIAWSKQEYLEWVHGFLTTHTDMKDRGEDYKMFDRDWMCGVFWAKIEGSIEYIIDLENQRNELQKQVGEYKRKIEQGTLIELPCKVGDTVWTINCWQEYGKQEFGERYIVTRYELHENKCSCIEINDKNYYRGEISIKAKESYKGVTPWVFLTREEAEKKLKELQE